MATVAVSVQMAGSGINISSQASVTNPVAHTLDQSVAASPAGTLTTRTDANTGTITMASGSHGITTGSRVDIHWTDPTTGLAMCQHKVTVGTVSGTSVPIDLGVGDNLPVLNSAVVVAPSTPYEFALDYAKLTVLGFGATVGNAKVVLQDSGGSVVFHTTIPLNGGGYVWTLVSGVANPVSADVLNAYISNGSSAAANRISGLAQQSA